jgi:hypothetical protein
LLLQVRIFIAGKEIRAVGSDPAASRAGGF